MTHMFDNFTDNTAIGDNMHPKFPPITMVVDNDNVDPITDMCGKLIGYKWNYGCDIAIALTVNINIMVYSNSIIYNTTGQAPTTSTSGTLGQRAYNKVDIRSWKLTNIASGVYTWTEDEQLTFMSDGDTPLTLTPSMQGQDAIVILKNFRGEEILAKTYNTNDFTFTLNATESNEIQKGMYSMEVFQKSLEDSQIIIENRLQKLINKYQILVQ